MKRFILLIFLLFPFVFWGIDLLPEKKEVLSVPNPLDLKVNWWDYYDVDPKTLKERLSATEAYYIQIQDRLSEEEYEKTKPFFDRILVGLQAIIDLKERQAPTPPPSPISGKYTYQEWIGLIKKMLEEKESLQYLKLRLDLATSSYKSGSRYVDTRLAAYLKQEASDPARLVDGLILIQSRISTAIEKIQIGNLSDLIGAKTASISLIRKEIDASYRKIDYSTVTAKAIQEDLNKAISLQKTANANYILSYETLPTVSSEITPLSSHARELSDQALLSAKIEYDLSRVDVINLEIQEVVVSWVKDKKKISKHELKEKMETWKGVIDEIAKEIPSSESSSELILQQSLKTLALQSENVSQGFPPSRSLELSELAILKIEQLKNALFLNEFLTNQLIEIKREFYFSFFDQFTVFWENIASFFKNNAKWFEESLFKIGDFPITPWGLIKFLIILIVAVILGKLSLYFINYLGKRQNRIKITSIYILGRLTYYFFITLGILIAGSAIGLDLTIFAYVAGALAIWVGFSLQSIFHNFISGIIVLLTRNLRINDVIELDTGETGTVTDLSLRTTVIRTFDGKDIVLPNADLVNKKFLNHTLSSYTLRLRIPFRAPLGQDKNLLEKIAIEAAKKVEITSESYEPELWMTGYGESWMNVELVVWVNSFIRGKAASRESQYYWALDDALKEHNISIPTPLQNIYFKSKTPLPMKGEEMPE